MGGLKQVCMCLDGPQLYLIYGPYLTEGPMTSQLEADTMNCR